MTNRWHTAPRWAIGCLLVAASTALAGCDEVTAPQPTDGAPASVAPGASGPTRTPEATATAPVIPLADTPTPTITPTPIVHVVQGGETLLAIAQNYGVSVEALQEANGIDDPRRLRVGQELIIPSGAGATRTSSGLLLPTPTPSLFSWAGVAFYETPVGSLECLGEIVNTTAVTITNAQVRVTLLDAVGERLIEADAFAMADLLRPGERAPFRILFTNPPTGWANTLVTALRGEAAGELAAPYVPIAIARVDGEPSGPQFQVSGVVRNASTGRAAGSVIVIATTYDDQGSVTGFRQGAVELEGTLAPGATAPFELLFSYHGGTPSDFNVIALGRVPAG